MSQGEPMPWAEAWAVAEGLLADLAPVCERAAIAGSLRRRRPMVRDIELVVAPRFRDEPDGLFDTRRVDCLEEWIAGELGMGRLRLRRVEAHRESGVTELTTRNGAAYKALEAAGLPVDLFIVRPPATWGVIFGLRTGPGQWNTRLVTECKAVGRRVSGGQVERWHAVNGWEVVPTPEEADFFAALGQEWVDPADRAEDRVRITRPAQA